MSNMEHLNLDDVISGAIDPENNNINKESMSEDKVSSIQECVRVLQQSAKMASDSIQALADVLLEPDGSLKDLVDKKGRAKLMDAISKSNIKIDQINESMEELPHKLEKAIPSSVKAELCDEDRKRIDALHTRAFRAHLIDIIIGFLLTILFFSTTYSIWNLKDSKTKLEQTRVQQQEIIEFGYAVKKYSPKTFKSWKRAKQESIEERND